MPQGSRDGAEARRPARFEPIDIGPHGTGMTEGGILGERQIAYYEAHVPGGAGRLAVAQTFEHGHGLVGSIGRHEQMVVMEAGEHVARDADFTERG